MIAEKGDTPKIGYQCTRVGDETADYPMELESAKDLARLQSVTRPHGYFHVFTYPERISVAIYYHGTCYEVAE